MICLRSLDHRVSLLTHFLAITILFILRENSLKHVSLILSLETLVEKDMRGVNFFTTYLYLFVSFTSTSDYCMRLSILIHFILMFRFSFINEKFSNLLISCISVYTLGFLALCSLANELEFFRIIRLKKKVVCDFWSDSLTTRTRLISKRSVFSCPSNIRVIGSEIFYFFGDIMSKRELTVYWYNSTVDERHDLDTLMNSRHYCRNTNIIKTDTLIDLSLDLDTVREKPFQVINIGERSYLIIF